MGEIANDLTDDMMAIEAVRGTGADIDPERDEEPEDEIFCPYCDKPATLVTGEIIYPHRLDLYEKQFWYCELCNAYVGCHGLTSMPLGTMANADLRSWRKAAHNAFDSLWKGKGRKVRSSSYSILANILGIDLDDCHIGQMDIAMCKSVIEAVKNSKESTTT